VLATREGCDLVAGHRGRAVLQELFLGSTVKVVINRAQCSVLVVRKS